MIWINIWIWETVRARTRNGKSAKITRSVHRLWNLTRLTPLFDVDCMLSHSMSSFVLSALRLISCALCPLSFAQCAVTTLPMMSWWRCHDVVEDENDLMCTVSRLIGGAFPVLIVCVAAGLPRDSAAVSYLFFSHFFVSLSVPAVSQWRIGLVSGGGARATYCRGLRLCVRKGL